MRATLAMTVAAMTLAGCATQPMPSSPGLPTPTVAVAAPSEDARESAVAAEEIPTLPDLCDPPGQLVPGGLARVNRDTVTHIGPGPHYEPTGSAIADVASTRLSDPYRLLAGDRVVVEEGPLRVGDVDWFLVYSAEERGVVSVGATVPTTSDVWVPAHSAEGPLLEPIDGITVHCPYAAAGGPGRAGLVIPLGQCSHGSPCGAAALAWAATAPSGSCRLVIVDSGSDEVLVDAAVSEWSSGASWWNRAQSRLLVDTDCIWSVRTAEA